MSGAAVSSTRIALWDNARFVIIVLVVIGHAVSTVRDQSALSYGIYTFIFLFHMPAMIALSGYFSHADARPKVVRSTLQLLAVWLIWEGIWALIHLVVEGQLPGDKFLVAPAWTLWFLVSLATMRILLPYLARMRHPLLLAIALALASGFTPAIGTEFSAARTLSFLPFFVLGWMARSRGWLTGDWFVRPTRGLRAAGAAVLACVACVFAFVPNLREIWRVDTWLTWREDDAWLLREAPIEDWTPPVEIIGTVSGMAITALLLVIAAVMTVALLLIVPRGHSRITTWGTRTLFVYLLHGPIIWGLRQAGLIDAVFDLGWVGVLLLVLGSTLLAIALSTALVAKVSRPLIEPKIDGLLVPEPGRVARE